jgi:hypothetical protein
MLVTVVHGSDRPPQGKADGIIVGEIDTGIIYFEVSFHRQSAETIIFGTKENH